MINLKIKLICDSLCDIPKEIQNKAYLDVVPLTIIFNDKEYKDGVDISKEEYYNVRQSPQDYPEWYVGLVGFCASFGAGWWNGFAHPYHDSKNPEKIRDYSNESIRNLIKQAPKLEGIEFACADFRDIEIPDNAVVYCDPPYKDTRKYKGVSDFPYDEYYDWCRENGKRAKFFMSEAYMPNDFSIVWEKEVRQQLDKSNRKYRPERLYTI